MPKARSQKNSRVPHTFAFFANVWAPRASLYSRVRMISLGTNGQSSDQWSLLVITMHFGGDGTHTSQKARCVGHPAWGNLTNRDGVSGMTGCGTEGLVAPATTKNQISTNCYDIAGNMLGTGSCPSLPYSPYYVYDAENRLRNLTLSQSPQYLYDGDAKRVIKTGLGNKLYWTGTGSETLTETSLSGTPTADYSYFNGKRVARVDLPGGAVHYYFSDHLGSASVVASNLGVIQEESDYYPYGGERVITNGDPNRYKFTGKERDSESGLDNFGARYDASNLGRFMTPDPLGGKLVDPQSLNKYSYVRNNPINLTDPTGLYICEDSPKDCSSDQDKKFEAARQADLNRGGDAARAAGAYGDPTKDNGVNVSFADFSKDSERGSTTSSLGADANGFRANSNVVIDSTASGDKLEAVVGHEGTHVADAQDFVKSITPDGHGDFKVGQDITQYQTEQRAYHVSDSILRSGNQSEKYQCGLGECVLGVGLKNPGQVTAEVDRILQHNYKSSVNKQPLTPTNQGGSVVPLAVVPH